ncbi:DNA-repair protein XRCC1 [Sesamum angolense]|uniref:DNA-repair protein XRCC1 n=1 Tax=Sesamum angolense TaxID=2727404 RepID=A0AAE1WKU7_9LAMI|nr:DNA-repair protein XRCC1 [Sesamum angolense]
MSESNARKRNLPSWMSSREEENDDGEKSKQPRPHGKSNKDHKAFHVESKVEENSASGSATSSGASDFSKLMDWISECYNQRKLVDIETYLLHAGKPWRKQSISHEAREDIKQSTSSNSLKQEEKMKGCFSPAKVKKWAVEDLKRTISWLENQDEKGIQQITEQWACLPRVVEQLAQLDGTALPGKDDLCKEAMVCKQIYELEFLNLEHVDIVDNKRPQTHRSKKVGNTKENDAGDGTSYDSDATVEMTEEEIDQAYNTIACSL